ncbi:CapA family protein [Clostridium sp. AN503]|uniref:CapA family protein n=1 Tax=Clostridium sp. AN503 TaxID=3160598 RepID=UPI003459A836
MDRRERIDWFMRKGRRRGHRNSMVFGVCMIILASTVLTGCQAHKYDRIELETSVQEEIHINIEDGSGDEDAGIVIDQEPVGKESSSQDIIGKAPSGQENVDGDVPGQDAARSGNQDAATLLFGGDVLLSSHVLNAYQSAGGIHGVLDEGYRKVIRDAGFFMVNEEFPFSSRGVQAEDKEYTFRLEPERVSMFQEMGIDAVTLANNHALDFGQEALLDSVAVLDGAGILHTGAGANLTEARKPVEIVIDGQRIAVIGATRVIPESSWAAGKNHPGMLSSYDATELLKEIRAQKDEGKLVIVYVHWGIERDENPQEYQRTLGQQYIDAGADLVIGSHPHVLQGIEYYKGKPIVYSLGNFVFGSSIPKTMLLEVKLPEEDAPLRLRLIPGTSGAGYTRMLNDAGKIQEFYQYIESISFGISIGADGTVIPQNQ